MTRITGRQINVGIGKETTRGTSVAPGYWYPKLDFDFDDKNEKVMNESGMGVIEKNNAAHITKRWSEGSIQGKIFRNGIAYFLMMLFGQAPTTTTVETTAKKHSFAVAQNNTHLSATLAVKEPNQDLRYALAMLDSFKIDLVVDDYGKFDCSVIAKKSASASNTVAYVEDSEFIPKHVVLKLASALAGLTGATGLTDVVSISLEFKKNLAQNQALGNIDLENITNTDFEVSGKLEKYYNDTTFKDYDHGNTHRALRLDLIDTDTVIGASTNPSLRFDFAEVVFKNWSKGMGNSDVVTESIEFDALWNLAAASMVTAELVNDTASY